MSNPYSQRVVVPPAITRESIMSGSFPEEISGLSFESLVHVLKLGTGLLEDPEFCVQGPERVRVKELMVRARYRMLTYPLNSPDVQAIYGQAPKSVLQRLLEEYHSEARRLEADIIRLDMMLLEEAYPPEWEAAGIDPHGERSDLIGLLEWRTARSFLLERMLSALESPAEEPTEKDAGPPL